VFQDVNDIWANSIEKPLRLVDRKRADIENFSYTLLPNTVFDRSGDHPVLLNGSKSIYALVVGEGFVVSADKASNLGLPELPHSFNTHVTIEKQIFAPVEMILDDDRWLDRT